MSSPSVTAVIINFQTPDLTHRAVTSFRHFYPSIPLLIIDNGSAHQSRDLLHQLDPDGPTELLLNPTNLHHGPAMDQALHRITTEFTLFLDSDCEVIGGGFVERMSAALLHDDRNYVAGKRIFMNARGFDVDKSAGAYPYIRPICMMVKRALYLQLPPFEKHGAPCLANMIAATERGLELVHIPIDEYVRHDGRGTAARFGYQLGLKGRLNHLLNRLGL
jgi:hypothetical protein